MTISDRWPDIQCSLLETIKKSPTNFHSFYIKLGWYKLLLSQLISWMTNTRKSTWDTHTFAKPPEVLIFLKSFCRQNGCGALMLTIVCLATGQMLTHTAVTTTLKCGFWPTCLETCCTICSRSCGFSEPNSCAHIYTCGLWSETFRLWYELIPNSVIFAHRLAFGWWPS